MGSDVSQIARRCERAVVTAYRDLRQLGSDDLAAFQACTVLYGLHHPEASLNEARRLVAEWIDHHVVRGDRGPTNGCVPATDLASPRIRLLQASRCSSDRR